MTRRRCARCVRHPGVLGIGALPTRGAEQPRAEGRGLGARTQFSCMSDHRERGASRGCWPPSRITRPWNHARRAGAVQHVRCTVGGLSRAQSSTVEKEEAQWRRGASGASSTSSWLLGKDPFFKWILWSPRVGRDHQKPPKVKLYEPRQTRPNRSSEL